jgi:DNA-binding NarL/FixJ family response regulator
MIDVFVLGETRLYREGLADLLTGAGFHVTGTGTDLASSASALRVAPPNIVLLDVAGAEGIDPIRSLVELLPDAAVVAFGVSGSKGEVLACAEMGARGYVTRDQSRDDLVQVLESVARGEAVCSPQIAAALMQRVAALATTESTPDGVQLTRRELEIAALVEAGLSNKEIATQLVIEVATVKTHVHNILEKLKVRRRTEAAVVLRQRPELRQTR